MPSSGPRIGSAALAATAVIAIIAAAPSGSSGSAVARGASAPTGPSISTGSTGSSGSTAPSGPSGSTGPSGSSGATGSSGSSGATGSSGPTGAAGPPSQITPTRYRVIGCRSHGDRAYAHGPPVREVAIGFDDGPSPDTAAFVRMLERTHTRATFFMIGEQVTARYRATLLRELRDGDVLGDHTFTHPFLTRTANVRGQLADTIAAIHSLTGYTPCVFRPPYGAYDDSILATARSLGLATVLWNVDPSDWSLPGTSAIEQRVLAEVRPGSIVISHDGGGPRAETLAAYPAIIARLRAEGYRIVTIPQLLGFKPVYVRCVRLCDGIGVRRGEVPHDAIIERAP